MTKHRVHQAKTQQAQQAQQAQQGFALPTVLLILTLASMAALLAWRNLWLTDQLLNIEADRLRTQHKAEAALPLAVRDILSANITYSNTANTVADWQSRISSATPVPQNETPYGANTAWYWIETYAHTETTLPLINSSIYRVTVLATGVMPNSTVVLQMLWTNNTNTNTNANNNALLSWHVLRE
jgi:Tfp pilus assembly protein PilX